VISRYLQKIIFLNI